jgi:FkbM family methyltransferase
MPTKMRSMVKGVVLGFVRKFPPLPQRLNGQVFWVHARARFSISTQTFFRREAHVRRWLVENLQAGQVFFDVGAHHGWVSMWALPLVGREGAVYSFEPSPANLTILEWHRAVNGHRPWTVVPGAVADEDAQGRSFYLIDSGDSPMNSLTSGTPGMPLMERRNISEFTVATVTLDKFCRDIGLKPNLVKIDVEGAELMVLRGARELLSQARPVIILAVHPYWLPAGQTPAEIADLLAEHNYELFDSTGQQVKTLRSGEYLCLHGN